MRLEDVKVGMKVRVIGTLMSNTDGWNNSWVPEMDAGVGRTFEVLSVCPFAQGIILKGISPKLGHNPLDDYHPWIFPWQVLEPVVENKAHPHAALMAQYAEDAKVKDRPWELWQCNDTGIWDDLGCNPAWCTNTQYRRKPSKPKTIKIGKVWDKYECVARTGHAVDFMTLGVQITTTANDLENKFHEVLG